MCMTTCLNIEKPRPQTESVPGCSQHTQAHTGICRQTDRQTDRQVDRQRDRLAIHVQQLTTDSLYAHYNYG